MHARAYVKVCEQARWSKRCHARLWPAGRATVAAAMPSPSAAPPTQVEEKLVADLAHLRLFKLLPVLGLGRGKGE